jgi:hypothetical protein
MVETMHCNLFDTAGSLSVLNQTFKASCTTILPPSLAISVTCRHHHSFSRLRDTYGPHQAESDQRYTATTAAANPAGIKACCPAMRTREFLLHRSARSSIAPSHARSCALLSCPWLAAAAANAAAAFPARSPHDKPCQAVCYKSWLIECTSHMLRYASQSDVHVTGGVPRNASLSCVPTTDSARELTAAASQLSPCKQHDRQGGMCSIQHQPQFSAMYGTLVAALCWTRWTQALPPVDLLL